MTTSLNATATIRLAIALLPADSNDTACDLICDTICDIAADITTADAILIARTALADDPHAAYHAAHIIDTLRDNCDFSTNMLD